MLNGVNPGEELFVSYLESRDSSFEREPLVVGRKPDFLVQVGRIGVACEVYEPEISLPRQQNLDGTTSPRGGFMDSYTRLRHGFEARKQDQIKAFSAAGFPVLLVFAETASEVPLDPVTMAEPMHELLHPIPCRRGPDREPTSSDGLRRRRPGPSQPPPGAQRRRHPQGVQLGRMAGRRMLLDVRLREAGLDRSLSSTKRWAEAWEIICAVHAEAAA